MILVELGNTNPRREGAEGPAVTYISIPDDYTYEVAESAPELAAAILADKFNGDPAITHMPGQEAAIAVHAHWQMEGLGQNPSWVWSSNDDFAVLLGHLLNAPVGRPADVEETHHTNFGPPGVGPREAIEAVGSDAEKQVPPDQEV